MRLQTSATGILEKTSRLLNAKSRINGPGPINEPAWYKVVAAHPPTHNLAARTHNLREYVNKPHTFPIGMKRRNTGTYITRNKTLHSSRSQHLYRPKQINFYEDKIRKLFYDQHPWELARPKLVVENDGLDASRQDWSAMDQIGKKLDGENVVQRTMYLMETEFGEDDWLKAYDKARLEFYRLRMKQEAEVQVANEEAVMFGSVFGKSYIDFGVEAEQKVIDKWYEDAIAETAARQARLGGGPAESEIEEKQQEGEAQIPEK